MRWYVKQTILIYIQTYCSNWSYCIPASIITAQAILPFDPQQVHFIVIHIVELNYQLKPPIITHNYNQQQYNRLWFTAMVQIIECDHNSGYEGYMQIAHVLPVASRINPASPHSTPQLFFIFQKLSLTPTSSTPWFTFVRHLLKTPERQLDQLLASTATDTGLSPSTLIRLSHPETSLYPEMFNLVPVVFLQVWSLAVYWYYLSLAMPLSWMQSNAESIHPPLQPIFPQGWEQSTSYCSEQVANEVESLSLTALYMAAIAEKAQHEPQDAWSLTGLTIPLATQSILAPFGFISLFRISMVFLGTMRVKQRAWNQASDKSVNWLTPISQVLVGSALCSAILAILLTKMAFLYNSSPSFQQCFWQSDLYCQKEQDCPMGWLLKIAQAAATVTSKVATYLLSIINYYKGRGQSLRFKIYIFFGTWLNYHSKLFSLICCKLNSQIEQFWEFSLEVDQEVYKKNVQFIRQSENKLVNQVEGCKSNDVFLD